ncbi:MAG: Hsp70 family protein [Rickettsiales bacterium]|nr:Hsp70 family protein [Rickettsiales bacterium]
MALLQIQEPSLSQENQGENDIVIGIDLGTTNSLAAIIVDEKVKFFADENGNEIHPSIVKYDDEKIEISSIKRLMGKSFLDVKDQKFSFKIDADSKEKEGLKIIVGDRKISAPEISAEILKHLKNLVKFAVKKAVITVPAYFDEAAKNATKLAANLAGLEVLRLVNEPTAAALAYGLDNSIEGTYCVFDLGGGTFDVSVLKMQKGVFKVLGVAGDNALGGDDFDDLLAEKLKISKKEARKIKEELSQTPSYDGVTSEKEGVTTTEEEGVVTSEGEVVVTSERDGVVTSEKEGVTTSERKDVVISEGKCVTTSDGESAVTSETEGSMTSFSVVTPSYDGVRFTITRADFEKLITPKINKTITLTKNLLNDLDLETSEIKGVIMVGGSTRIPLVKQKLAEIFGEEKILDKIDPDRIVAAGAAWQAYNLSGNSQNLLLDVVPLSLGIEMMGGIVDKIILRNSTIPASATKEFTTYADNQNGMKLHIVQGERELAKDCRSLAEFEIKNIPAMKAGLARVAVTFKVDADGLLTVSAEEKITKQKQEIIVKPSYGLNENEVKKMLLDSLKNSKTDIAARLLIETITEANHDIDILKKDLENFADKISSAEKKLIVEKINILEKLIATKAARDLILEAQKQLAKAAENLVLQKVNAALETKIIGKKIS